MLFMAPPPLVLLLPPSARFSALCERGISALATLLLAERSPPLVNLDIVEGPGVGTATLAWLAGRFLDGLGLLRGCPTQGTGLTAGAAVAGMTCGIFLCLGVTGAAAIASSFSTSTSSISSSSDSDCRLFGRCAAPFALAWPILAAMTARSASIVLRAMASV